MRETVRETVRHGGRPCVGWHLRSAAAVAAYAASNAAGAAARAAPTSAPPALPPPPPPPSPPKLLRYSETKEAADAVERVECAVAE